VGIRLIDVVYRFVAHAVLTSIRETQPTEKNNK